MTQFQNIFNALKDNGFELYPPATKTGQCTAPYVVIKYEGSSPIAGFSSKQDFYSFLIYVPKDKYTELEAQRVALEQLIAKKLYPMLMPVGSATADFYDDTVKAHMTSIMYRNNVRNKHL